MMCTKRAQSELVNANAVGALEKGDLSNRLVDLGRSKALVRTVAMIGSSGAKARSCL